jgi:uncharacterized membrane protein YkoI
MHLRDPKTCFEMLSVKTTNTAEQNKHVTNKKKTQQNNHIHTYSKQANQSALSTVNCHSKQTDPNKSTAKKKSQNRTSLLCTTEVGFLGDHTFLQIAKTYLKLLPEKKPHKITKLKPGKNAHHAHIFS